MYALKQLSEVNSDCEISSVSHLVDLYEVTIEELQVCANINPTLEDDPDAADKREADLLSLEEKLLNQAAHIQLKSKDDVLKLINIWEKASDVNSGEDASVSDRIAMNIFRHTTRGNVT